MTDIQMQTSVKFNADRGTNELTVTIEIDSLDAATLPVLVERIEEELVAGSMKRSSNVYRLSLSCDVNHMVRPGEEHHIELG